MRWNGSDSILVVLCLLSYECWFLLWCRVKKLWKIFLCVMILLSSVMSIVIVVSLIS